LTHAVPATPPPGRLEDAATTPFEPRAGPKPAFDPLVCDLDGTILDSRRTIVGCLAASITEVGSPVPSHEELARCVGPPLEISLVRVLGEAAPVHDIIRAYRERYTRVAPAQTELMPDSKAVLVRLANRGVRMGVATHKAAPIAALLLDAHDLTALFDTVIAALPNDAPAAKADLVRAALRELSSPRSRPLYVGDHDDDEAAAADLGIAFARYPDVSWLGIEQLVLCSP